MSSCMDEFLKNPREERKKKQPQTEFTYFDLYNCLL